MPAGWSTSRCKHFIRDLEDVSATVLVVVEERDRSDWFIDKFELVQILMLVEYLLTFGMCLAFLLYLRRNRHIALTRDSSAARKVLLPAFEPLLWMLGCTVGVYVIAMIFLESFGWYRGEFSDTLLEAFYSMRLFVFALVMTFLLQKSVSIPALRRSVAITIVLALYNLPVHLLLKKYVESKAPNVSFAVMSTLRALMLLVFIYVCIWPPARASKRTFREYCVFMFTYSALYFSSKLCFYLGKVDAGFMLTYITIIWALVFPVVMWRVLKADTEFWRGLGNRAVELQALFLHRHSIDERISSQGLHVLIEMHRKLIIDFAHIKLQKRIGTGASAVVFNGMLHPVTPVAIKVYTPTTFSEETVAEFSQEAALCGALHHPNIVKFYGMCVYPPTICLVSELCQGTLGDITCAAHTRYAEGGPRYCKRQQMLLNLCYMLDAARAVAYLHSFSPPFLHRDIKPANFLVDVHGTVKLTDFGESRSLARSRKPHPVDIACDALSDEETMLYATLSSSPIPPQLHTMMYSLPKMTVKGTVDYMAPEIINGKAGLATYGEAADVYSLAMTMWDVLHPGAEKYPDIKNNHLQIFANVVEGKRPRLESHTAGGQMHTSVRDIIQAAWLPDPRSRPSAQMIVKVLESVQEELLAAFAVELLPELSNDISSSVCKTRRGTADLFHGELVVARMQDMRYVQSPCEAVRLGSAFMDAGLMHHKKHACNFENTSLKYFFDEENILLCQPLGSGKHSSDFRRGLDEDSEYQQARLGSSTSTPCRGSSTGSDDHSSIQNNATRSKPFRFTNVSQSDLVRTSGTSVTDGKTCRCRKLGQRLELSRSVRGHKLRKKIQAAVGDDSVLTAKLLDADASSSTPSHVPIAMDSFDFVGTDVRAA